MKILVVGSGGREHALVWKIAQSKRVDKIYAAPGNPGMKELAELVNIKPTSIVELADFARENGIDLTIVGPEQPLALGIVDEFNKQNLRIFGPTQKAAAIESSKVFAKNFMKKNYIPTANFEVFNSLNEAMSYLRSVKFPQVIKADGLAGGKGVAICNSVAEAEGFVRALMVENRFGQSGETIVIEDYLVGRELSFMVLTDGRRTIPLVTAMDYKKLKENNLGPNTGGMGAISPAPSINRELFDEIMKSIINPTIEGLRFENRNFKGVLYAGLMITKECPKVLEFNCRFGDPEAQVVLMRMKSDLVDLLDACVDENLLDTTIEFSEHVSGCVVLATKGYPDKYETGKKINGLERARSMGVEIFHAGTALAGNELVTAGGRVLNICTTSSTLKDTMDKIYDAISFITYDNIYFRRDIGWATS